MKSIKSEYPSSLPAGPGCGKSTTMAHVFAELKWKGIVAEMATEYAKDMVWSNAMEVLQDQVYVFGKQHHRIFRLADKVEVILTDSPFLLSLIYDQDKSEALRALALEKFHKFDNLNFLLQRRKGYKEEGRLQSEEQAIEKDMEIKAVLEDNDILYRSIAGARTSIPEIVERIIHALKKDIYAND